MYRQGWSQNLQLMGRVQGKGFPGAKHRGFVTYQEAQNWIVSAGYRVLSGSDSEIEIVSTGPAPNHTSTERKQKAPVYVLSDDSDIEIIDPPPSTSTTMSPSTLLNPKSTDIVLSAEQRGVLGKVKRGESVFFTGSAGTGKSVLLREIIRHFRDQNIAITASTG
ncbi:hypothetical protein BDP27DRAFT_1056128 [Rhodocollybia butyracea]|uniref:ATP-dependent DNA helicase n=1 Tax=Rhodocollybia butyracea TaxID=206335 RepID=A0A9P5PQE8_9AGAR|nr:hypothetical protein BDP27DRAFT_1056128 [Rhodocollybia butyracea]